MQRDLHATATIAPHGGVMTARAFVLGVADPTSDPIPSTELFASASVDLTVGHGAQPPATGIVREQIVGYRLVIGEREFWPADLTPPVTWHEELGAGATLSFRLPWHMVDVGLGTLDRVPFHAGPLNERNVHSIGEFWTYMGIPPGLAAINFYGIYVTATGRHEVPLMIGGEVESVRADSGPEGRFLSLTCADRKVRHDKRNISFVLPPGHGKTRGVVARMMLAKAGVASELLSLDTGGVGLKKGIQLLDANAWGAAANVLAAGGFTLETARNGELVALPLVDVSSRIVATLGESDFSRHSQGANTDSVTRITLTGTKVIPAEEREDGLRTVERVTESFDPSFVPAAAVQRQNTGGTLTALSLTPEGRSDGLISRVTHRQFYQGDTPIGDETVEEAFFNLQAARYLLALDGTPQSYEANVYLFETGAQDDATLAYRWPVDRFQKRTVERNSKTFDERNFLVGKTTRRYGPVLRRARVKERSFASDPWTSEDYVLNQQVLGDGTGVPNLDRGEVLAGVGSFAGTATVPGTPPSIAEQIDTTYEVTDDGYVLAEREQLWAWTQTRGATKYFADETTSKDNEWRFRVVEETVVYYVEGEGENAKRITSSTVDGKAQPTIVEDIDGYFPQAETLGEPVVTSDEYTSEEAAEFAKAASRFGNEAFVMTASFPGLEATRERQDRHEESHDAEDEQDAYEQALRTARIDSAIEATVELPALNLLLSRGSRVTLRDRASGTLQVVHITAVSWSDQGGGAAIPTTLQGRVYVL